MKPRRLVTAAITDVRRIRAAGHVRSGEVVDVLEEDSYLTRPSDDMLAATNAQVERWSLAVEWILAEWETDGTEECMRPIRNSTDVGFDTVDDAEDE